MDKKESKKRKCGPRVKTGCITCRIRRVKCDEGKPSCERCTSTGRKCDGYTQPQQKAVAKSLSPPTRSSNTMQPVQPLSMIFAMPFSVPGSERERQFFQFYCVQSAFDLSVYLNSAFWYNMILQYSHKYPVIRQAVVAFGASHTYALNVNSKNGINDEFEHGYEQAKQYDKAIRWLRAYMETGEQPDPHVILICCALFFSCENGRGNRTAALSHLERGLSIINAEQRKRTLRAALEAGPGSQLANTLSHQPEAINNNRSASSEIDEELLYVFSRLDCQATLCQDTREPVLDLEDLTQTKNTETTSNGSFRSLTSVQRSLDVLHNRLARFLTKAAPHRQDSAETLPPWVAEQKRALHIECANWEGLMNDFITIQSPEIKHILQRKGVDRPQEDPNAQLALQIRLLVLHHRCWWMLFRSSYPDNPSVFTMSPNPRAEEILDICEFLGFSLPVRPSASPHMSDADMAWKLISEIGVAAPLFVLATKCEDPSVQMRARRQLEALREHRNGVYDKMYLTRVMKIIEQQQQDGYAQQSDYRPPISGAADGASQTQTLAPFEFSHRSPYSVSDSEFSQFSLSPTDDFANAEETRELLGWGRKSSIV